ncbi:MAG: hypothetical protein IKW28_10845 [Lachnospiraceae bacterium]|nr:hypothetical protein [Lachnospiraceae bacterium]
MLNQELDMLGEQSNYGNYGHGLAKAFMAVRENVGNTKASHEEVQGETEKRYVSEPNSLKATGGIMTVESLRKLSGWQQEFKSSTLLETIQSLEQFHGSINQKISLNNLKEVIDSSTTSYNTLIEKVSHYVERGRSWYAGVHIHRKEEKAMLPAMSTLLIKLYSLGNVFQYLENISYDYLMENQIESADLKDIVEGKGALSVQGNMVSTGIQKGQIDKTAFQMKKRNGSKATLDKRQELLQRTLPTLKGTDRESVDQYLSELQNIARMVDDLELQSDDALEREDVKIDFIDVSKMIQVLLKSPFLLSERDVKEKGTGNYRESDLVQTMEYYRLTQGLAVKDALALIDQKRQEAAETAAADSIKSGGELSQVLIDVKEKRVLRTSKEKGGAKKQREKNNFNYDEAMSRLGEITGLGSQAGARTTYYKDTEGQLQYGTNMELARGKNARDTKLSFGNEKADSSMRSGRYNIFGYSTKEELTKNAGLIISSFKLQILDYISYHQDRHYENFFIDLEAKDPTQAFVGIDNDNVFGKGTLDTKKSRVISYESQAKRSYEGETVGGVTREQHDVTSTLPGFACIPKETAEQIRNLDERAIDEGMQPYLDRAARFALLARIKALKKYGESQSKIVDVYTPEGMREFKKETMGLMVKTMMDVKQDTNMFGEDQISNLTRMAPGILVRAIMMQYFDRGRLAKKEDKPGEYKYTPAFEYVPEGESLEEFFSAKNQGRRTEQYWKVIDAMIEESGQTKQQVWDKYIKDRFGDRGKEVEETKEFQKYKALFMAGKMKIFFTWKDGEM